jgi:hypothetical protein
VERLIKLEELGLFLLSILLFTQLDYGWWVYLALLLAPDLGMIGYVFGPVVGATAYDLTHHKGLAIALYAVGVLAAIPPLSLAGIIMIGHSSLDRVLGYGVKYSDSFQHTHLGWIGRVREAQAWPSPDSG